MNDQTRNFSGIIHRIIADISYDEAVALHLWSSRLLALRNSPKNGKEKFREVIQLTKDVPILFPLIKRIAFELKSTGWDDQSWKSRIGTGAALWITLMIAKAGAGLAILGGAIAVPLWIVFGSGDKFVKMLISELKKRMPSL